jgi:hypothetical protein
MTYVRKLLWAGLVGPPLFILVFLIEGLTRPGYSAWRHYVSQLATGPGGWVQVVNFLVCGTLVIAFAIGLRATTRSVAAPILFGLLGAGLIVAGVFSTDPTLDYPVGAPQVHTTHGMIHGLAGLADFTLLPAATFVMAAWFARHGSGRWMRYSLVVGVTMIATFIATNVFSTLDMTGRMPNAPTGFVQRVAIIAGWTWISMVALHFIRATSPDSQAA